MRKPKIQISIQLFISENPYIKLLLVYTTVHVFSRLLFDLPCYAAADDDDNYFNGIALYFSYSTLVVMVFIQILSFDKRWSYFMKTWWIYSFISQLCLWICIVTSTQKEPGNHSLDCTFLWTLNKDL